MTLCYLTTRGLVNVNPEGGAVKHFHVVVHVIAEVTLVKRPLTLSTPHVHDPHLGVTWDPAQILAQLFYCHRGTSHAHSGTRPVRHATVMTRYCHLRSASGSSAASTAVSAVLAASQKPLFAPRAA